MNESEFHVEVRDSGSLLVLALHGELDVASAPEVLAAVEAHGAGRQALVLDLSGLTFMDSSGINLFVRLQAQQDGTAVAFIAPTEAVGQPLDITQVRPLLTWVNTPKQALETRGQL
jgi:stage II sporulation protein AA (anti-sigma F factor antagonist)